MLPLGFIHCAFGNNLLLTVVVLFELFAMKSAGSCVYGSKTYSTPTLGLIYKECQSHLKAHQYRSFAVISLKAAVTQDLCLPVPSLTCLPKAFESSIGVAGCSGRKLKLWNSSFPGELLGPGGGQVKYSLSGARVC